MGSVDIRWMVKKHMRNKSKRNKYQLMFPNENTAYEEPATVTFRKSTMREGMMWLTTATGVRHSITTIAAREYWNTCIANGWKVVEE